MSTTPSFLSEPDRLAWIFGSSRSGSTWLLRMLTELEGTVGIDDPHIGHHLGVWRPIALAYAEADPPPLRTLGEVKADRESYFFAPRYREAWEGPLRELIASRFEAECAERAGGSPVERLIVKEPGSQSAELLMSLFEGSRLIFLLRDGRDVVDSWLDAYRDGAWAMHEGAYAAGTDTRLGLVRWQSAVWAQRTRTVRSLYDRLPPGRRVLIRYEDLLAGPEAELARTCEVLGCAADEGQLRRAAASHAFDKCVHGTGRRERAASPGNWRSNLSPQEQREMLAILEPELRATGYLHEDEAARPPRLTIAS